MSLLPFLHDIQRPHVLPEDRLGINWAQDMRNFVPSCHGILGTWHHLAAALRDTGATVVPDKDKFQLNVDVSHFAPEEIFVKTADGFVVVEGVHEERRDEHGFIARRFVRRYALPEGCLADTVQASLSSDGVLTVSAPRKLALPDEGERIVPVQRTGPVRKQPADVLPSTASPAATDKNIPVENK